MNAVLVVASWLLAPAPPASEPAEGVSVGVADAASSPAASAVGEAEDSAADASEDATDRPPSVAAPEPGDAATAPAGARQEKLAEGPVAITTRISPDPSNIGDVLELEVVAAYPRGYTVNLPSVLSFDPLHLVSLEETEPEATGEGLRKVFTIALQHFEVGEAQVPTFALTYVTPDGQVQTIDVPPRAFTVESLLANEADPQRKGEDPPISIVYPNLLAELVIYVVLGLFLALAIGWLIGRRLRGRARPVVVPPPIPAHEVALEALEELEKGGLIEQERWQDYYLQLTEIAKGYFEGRFGIEALDRTTDEIRRSLIREGDRLAPLLPTDVVAFLERCDLVKFARFAPEPDDARGELDRVRAMVRDTMPAAGAPARGATEREGEANEEAALEVGTTPAADDGKDVEPHADVRIPVGAEAPAAKSDAGEEVRP